MYNRKKNIIIYKIKKKIEENSEKVIDNSNRKKFVLKKILVIFYQLFGY